MDYKWLFTTLLGCISLGGVISIGGVFMWRSHLKAIAQDWKEIAEARAERITELIAHNGTLEEQNKRIVADNEKLQNTVETLLRKITEYEALFKQMTRGSTTERRRPTKAKISITENQG